MSPYAASKLAAENYALAYGASFGLSVLAFRLFNVFGPLQPANHAYAAVIPKFVDAALNGRRVTVYGDGLQTRDFTFVDSVTDVIIRAVREQVSHPGPVNLAFGTRTSLLEVIAHLEGILARPLEVDFQPSRRSDVRDSQADDSRLRSLLPGVEPLPFEIGLRRTIEWFRGRHPDAPLGDHS
jgi:UDP-glucose 4-epimerase